MLSFWGVAAAIVLVVIAVLARALFKGRKSTDAAARAASDIAVYKAQLAEVERDAARGIIPQAEAETLRTEVARRLLAADTAQSHETAAAQGPGPVSALIVIAICVLGSAAVYYRIGVPGYGDLALKDRLAFAEEMRRTRPSQKVAEESLPPSPQAEGITDQYAALVEQLRETVAQRPDDEQGHRLLASSEANMGNFRAAAEAMARVVAIRGDEASGEDHAQVGEFLVLAAGGYVSPQAEDALTQALNADRTNGRARYYLGLMFSQTGRQDRAFRIWDALLREGPEDAPWIEPILAQIEPMAQMAGVDYSVPAIGSSRGPTQEDIDAASEMTGAERMEMIRGMVAGLEDRLATTGGPAADWARLITALGVLGDRDRASAIHANAVDVFAGDPAALDVIQRAGEQAGVTN